MSDQRRQLGGNELMSFALLFTRMKELRTLSIALPVAEKVRFRLAQKFC